MMEDTYSNLLSSMLPMVFLCLVACKKDNEVVQKSITGGDIPGIEAALNQGDWRISYYFSNGQAYTDDYQGYAFTFHPDSTLGVTDGNTAISGAWSVVVSDSSNRNGVSSEIDLVLFFNAPEIFVELNGHWVVFKYSTAEIELLFVDQDNGVTDNLIFTKN